MKPRVYGASLGADLTVVYSAECIAHRKATERTAMLPLLVILFIVSYAILTVLVFEQGKTIESQRNLIREMLKDSTQLAALKGKLARDDSKRPQDKASVQAGQKGADPGSPAFGAKGSDKGTKRPSKPGSAIKVVPEKPAVDLEDVRRSTGVV
ncbi:MAG: hypothetical protein ABSG40_05040 [Terriglobales bacterium]